MRSQLFSGPRVILLFCLLCLILLNMYLGIFVDLTRRPESVHMWAMCDRASVARNYAEESMDFFKPRVNETRELRGITGLECPIVNYIAAICYKLFGFNEFWYRFTMMVILSMGLLAGFFFSIKIIGNNLAAILVVFIWYLSPVLNYYTPSFIPDTASLGFILLAWYFFFKFKENFSVSTVLWFTLFASLACLIKITSLISVVVMFVLLVFDYLKILDVKRNIVFHKKHWLIISLSFAVLVTIGWYKYADWLSKANNSGVFLIATNPAGSLDNAKNLLTKINDLWVPFYYHKIIYWLLGATTILLLIFYKRANRMLGLITVGLWFGNICFLYFMLAQFEHHDYYVIALLPALLFQFITFTEFIFRSVAYKKNGVVLAQLSLLVIFIISANFSKEHHSFRYDKGGWLYGTNPSVPYLNIEQYLRSLGIERTDKVLSMYDDSPDITLYFMNVKGWRVGEFASDDEILGIVNQHPKYIITNNDSVLKREKLNYLFAHLIGTYNNIKIYKVN